MGGPAAKGTPWYSYQGGGRRAFEAGDNAVSTQPPRFSSIQINVVIFNRHVPKQMTIHFLCATQTEFGSNRTLRNFKSDSDLKLLQSTIKLPSSNCNFLAQSDSGQIRQPRHEHTNCEQGGLGLNISEIYKPRCCEPQSCSTMTRATSTILFMDAFLHAQQNSNRNSPGAKRLWPRIWAEREISKGKHKQASKGEQRQASKSKPRLRLALHAPTQK